ncbi:hypothetical protein HY991_04355 [Candidatus Micrarchaeota archaeon]|nr:hypothetical protein [Candidatus Micrarchaeota archaeon]
MDVKYTPNGPKGRTCGDCVHFSPTKEKKGVGTCFGHDVIDSGSCNFFKKKQ